LIVHDGESLVNLVHERPALPEARVVQGTIESAYEYSYIPVTHGNVVLAFGESDPGRHTAVSSLILCSNKSAAFAVVEEHFNLEHHPDAYDDGRDTCLCAQSQARCLRRLLDELAVGAVVDMPRCQYETSFALHELDFDSMLISGDLY
jgi:hypothetical protein